MITSDVKFGKGVIVPQPELVNLYGCEIGDNTKIAAFVEIRKGVKIGKNVKIQPFVVIPEGVKIEDEVFIGPNVSFTNNRYPRTSNRDWEIVPTLVKNGVSICAGVTIVCGVTIGEHAMIGAGALVIKNIPARSLVVSSPGEIIGKVKD